MKNLLWQKKMAKFLSVEEICLFSQGTTWQTHRGCFCFSVNWTSLPSNANANIGSYEANSFSWILNPSLFSSSFDAEDSIYFNIYDDYIPHFNVSLKPKP